jgi:hypothetical protein
MKRYIALFCLMLCMLGCKKTEQLEQHEMKVLSVNGDVSSVSGRVAYFCTYQDIHTGITYSERMHETPPKEGSIFIKNLWIPVR